MATLEETRFELRCREFNAAVDDYKPNDDNAWSFIENRQQEIADAFVSDEKKAKAFDGVLAAIYNIFPRANTAYCQALDKRLSYTDKKNADELARIAKDAYFHSHDVDIMQYGKIIYEVYKHSKDKKNFPYLGIAKVFRKKQLQQEKALEREDREKRISELDCSLEFDPIDADRKLQIIDEIIDLAQEKYFGPILANKTKKEYCKMAVNICREELYDPQGADYYLKQSKEYDRRAERASIEWERRRNIPTKAKEEAYMRKYRSDNSRI